MSSNVTPTQALLLFGLLAFHGECPQAALMPVPTKPDREALEKAGLIGVEKVGRAFVLTLSDAGWNWAGANLSAVLPPAHGTLHAMLERLGAHLAKENETLASFIGAKPVKTVESKPAPPVRKTKAGASGSAPSRKSKKGASSNTATAKAAAKTKKSSRPAKPKAPTPAAVRKRIEAAYLSITGGRKNESVRLSLLREAMPDLARATVDVALGRILKSDKKASLMRNDDPVRLSSADHAAAFNPAGEPFHVIWIAS